MPPIAPSPTLFVKNLNTKIKKPELRRQLASLFAPYGKILDIVSTRAEGMRGQAFVVFRDLVSSTSALRGLDGFEFYDKPLQIQYARTKSKATLVQELGPEALFEQELAGSRSRLAAQSHSASLGSEKVTVSRAQEEAKGRERKRLREEAGHASDEEETKKARRDGAEDDDEDGEAMDIGDASDNDDHEDSPGPQPTTVS